MRHIIAVLAIISSADTAMAQQQQCGKTGLIESHISSKYGETIAGAGIAPDGNTIFVLSNPVSGTFTFMVKRKDGISCIIISGKGYQSVIQDKTIQGKEM